MIEELRIPPESSELPEKEVSRPVQVLAGLGLGAFTLFCGFALVTSLVVPSKKSRILSITVSFVLLLGLHFGSSKSAFDC
jgi:hypothetical protein